MYLRVINYIQRHIFAVIFRIRRKNRFPRQNRSQLLSCSRLSSFTSLTFLLCGLLASGKSASEYQLLDRAVAIVEDEIILASEVRDTMFQVTQTLKQRGRSIPPNDVLYEQVLEKTILDSLQLQRAKDVGLRISDQQLNEAMANFAANKGATLEQFRESIIARGESYAQAREQIRKELLIQQVQRRSVFRKIHIDDTEITNFLASEEGQAVLNPEFNLDHILLALDGQASDAAKLRAEQRAREIKQAASTLPNNQDKGFHALSELLERSGAEHSSLGWRKPNDIPSMFADIVNNMKPGELSEPILSDSGYHLVWMLDKKGGIDAKVNETKVRHILISPNEIRTELEAKTLALEIRQKLVDEESFVDLARIHSDDPGSALAGGDLGWSEPGKFVPAFELTMGNTADGEISEPFQSQYGWHILEVLERRIADHSEKQAKRTAQMAIANKKYDDALQNWLQELRDNAYIEMK